MEDDPEVVGRVVLLHLLQCESRHGELCVVDWFISQRQGYYIHIIHILRVMFPATRANIAETWAEVRAKFVRMPEGGP